MRVTPVGAAGPGPAAIREVAALGPYFAFEVHEEREESERPRGAAGSRWRPVVELLDPGAPAFAERVAAVRGGLVAGSGRAPEELEKRVAVSVAHLGLVARLLSPLLGCAAVLGHAPAAVGAREGESLMWQPELGGGFPLSISRRALAETASLHGAVVEGVLEPLEERARRMSVSARVVRGNAASAVDGAARAAAASGSPHAGRVGELAAELLEHPYFAGAFTRGSGSASASGSGRFRRRSCCLIYRAAPARSPRAVCGDCVLLKP